MKADAVDRFYNVGTGKRTSLKELAEMLLELTGSNQDHRLRAAQPGDASCATASARPSAPSANSGFKAQMPLARACRRLDRRGAAQLERRKRLAGTSERQRQMCGIAGLLQSRRRTGLAGRRCSR